MSQVVQLIAIIAAFFLALVLAPLALGMSALWLVGRALVYATATPGRGDIIGWTGKGSRDEIEAAQAFPRLSFVGYDGAVRSFTSRMAFNIYDEPPPTGALAVRYHLKPRLYAEIDNKAHWFTGPVLAIAAALLGTLIAAFWRPVAALWFGT